MFDFGKSGQGSGGPPSALRIQDGGLAKNTPALQASSYRDYNEVLRAGKLIKSKNEHMVDQVLK